MVRMKSTDMMNIALAAFFVTLAIAAFLYFRPRFMTEGFATIALDGETMPKCFLRDAEAQRILAEFTGTNAPASDAGMAYAELKLILQKALCMDADITGSGAGPYSTYQMPFATAHDIEPAASFVGRCVKGAVRTRDLEMVIDKFEARGIELINTLCAENDRRERVMTMFHNVLARASRNMAEKCLVEKASLDIPAGPRDPGYFEPDAIKELRPYTIKGGAQYF
jgi:hypothetical protein